MTARGKTAAGNKKPIATASQIVRDLFTVIDETQASRGRIAERAGVHFFTLTHWRLGKSSPRLADFESVVEAMGYRLKLERREP